MRETLMETVQPAWCRAPLPEKELQLKRQRDLLGERRYRDAEVLERVLRFDPSKIFLRVGEHIDPYLRIQEVNMMQLWPKRKRCACGCNRILKGRRTRWATENCSMFAVAVFGIIKGYPDVIAHYISVYYGGRKCHGCNRTESQILEQDDIRAHALELDHIRPVKHGGGGAWLTNYQLLCGKCHQNKTNQDFGWKQEPEDNQLKLF